MISLESPGVKTGTAGTDQQKKLKVSSQLSVLTVVYTPSTSRLALQQPFLLSRTEHPANPERSQSPIRKAFKAPQGRKLLKFDYNQDRAPSLRQLHRETRLIKPYKDGVHVHSLTASILFGVPPEQVTDAQRSLGKTINFGFLYGMGAERFARNLKMKENLDLSVEQAKPYRDKIFELYPGLSRWHRDCWRQIWTVPEPKEIRTPGLRRRLIKGGTDFNKFTDLTNTSIQGGCADAVKMAILALEAELPSGTGIVAMLHDELVIESDASSAEEMLRLAKQKMEESAGLVFKDVPMLVEGKIVDS
jgi:DNA polymerase I-like protein with 3'-5' exonuclease and polymerase domains